MMDRALGEIANVQLWLAERIFLVTMFASQHHRPHRIKPVHFRYSLPLGKTGRRGRQEKYRARSDRLVNVDQCFSCAL
jgi:hypothetical protein